MQLARSLPARDFSLAVFLIALATLLAFVSTAQAAAELGYGGEPIPWVGLLRARVVDWYLCFLFLPLLWWLAEARPIGRGSWAAALPLHLAASLACALAKEGLYVVVGNWFRPGVFHLPEILAGDYFDEVLLFWAMIGLVHAFRAYNPEPSPVAVGTEPPSQTSPDRFVVRTSAGYRPVRADEIRWIEAQGNYACLHIDRGAPLLRETMAVLERRLDPQFVRIHRRAIVNRDRIARIEPCSHGAYRIVLATGEVLISGRSYNRAVRRLIG